MRHATEKDKPLVDSGSDLYQLDQNLPSQVQRVKELYSSYWDKAWLIEQHIECKDRRHKFKTYPDCFVASECVDTLMHLKLVKSRKEGVFLMRKLIEKVCFCEPASSCTEFKDDAEFFYLVPKNKRIQEPPKRHQKKKKGEDASHNSRSTIQTKRSTRTSSSVRSRADSVRTGFVNHRESQSRSLAHFPVNAPRG
jgi:Domain found in Dishevelled, Egl-10, and Pleckstrin (DEP)